MKTRSSFTVMRRMVGLVRPLLGVMLLAIAMGVLGFACAIFLPILGGMGLLLALGEDLGLQLGSIFLLCGLCALARGCLRYAEQTCNHYIAFRLLALIRERVFFALRRLAPAKLEGRDKGDLISLITADIELLEVFYAHTISPVCIAAIMSLIMVLWIGALHWLLGLLALVAYATIGILLPLTIARRSEDAGTAFRQGSGALSALVLDSLRGLDQTIQYGGGQRRLADLEAASDGLATQQEAMSRLSGLNAGVTNSLILAFDLGMTLVALGLYQAGCLGFPGMLLAIIALLSSFGPVVALANLGSTLQNTIAAGNRVLDILEEEPAVEEESGHGPIPFSGAAAEDIGFSYGGENILDGLSLDFPQGQITGLVGRSGSGKSTLLKLLMRFWDCQQGRVTISGRDIRQVNTADLRQLEGYMTQDTHLFHASIAENLRIAKANATQQELEEACRKASIHSWIQQLPQGYETQVGELGDTLSGGERQRLGLARAFLHDAPLLLLDEPSSNLDSLNEAAVLKALQEGRGDKTVILVSHRRSTMGIADVVHTVEQGRIS